MLKFLDGPAQNVTLCCARAPRFLRVTRSRKGQFDALDQLTDTPEPGEVLYAYEKAEDHGVVHYDGRDKQGRRFGRWEEVADYRLCTEQPSDAVMRDRKQWAAWATTRAEQKA